MGPLSSPDFDKIAHYCGGCVKLKISQLEMTASCDAFNQPYPLWGEGECFARERSARNWRETLSQIKEYAESKGMTSSDSLLSQIEDEDTRARVFEALEIQQVFYEESHPQLKKAPHGEKQDRTHKMFGKQRMKDNRFIEPWV